MTTTAIFVDVSNLYYCINKRFEGRKLDYEKLLDRVTSFGTLTRAIAFGSQMADEALNFITCLRKLGYDTKYKKPRAADVDDRAKPVRRADWNVGLTIEVVNAVINRRCDTVILASSNPDLTSLISWVKGHGSRCIVMACGISKEIREVADQCIEIELDLLEVPKGVAA